ncbi:hypothetical protein [Streptomyces sp. NPDC093261]
MICCSALKSVFWSVGLTLADAAAVGPTGAGCVEQEVTRAA